MTARLPTMVTLHDIRFVECRWWNDGWTVKTVVTRRSSASMIPAPGHWSLRQVILSDRPLITCLSVSTVDEAWVWAIMQLEIAHGPDLVTCA